MKRICCILLFFLYTAAGSHAQSPLLPFPLHAIRLLNSPFLQAQQTDMNYMLALSPDRLLAPYLREAGLQPKAESYGNWENTGLDGHTAGHYLSALSMMYAATGNPVLLDRLHYMLSELEKCQQKNGNGYMGGVPDGKAMWQDIAQGKIEAGTFSLNRKWVPLYNLHKLYAGLADAWQYTGSEKAKELLDSYCAWAVQLTSGLTDLQVQEMLKSEHGGLNESFAEASAITGDSSYLNLARRFSDRTILNPLLAGKDMLTGLHANTQIPKVIGYMRIAELSGDRQWAAAADFFWHTVVSHRTVAIGGNSVREHFHPADDFSGMTESREGPETCNSYNMLKLTRHLFLAQPAAAYMDYYERTLYNHILSSQRPEGGFVYFSPMRPGHYRVYSQPRESFWCCVGSGLENHAKYGEMIYAHQGNDLFINLFIPSVLEWKEKGLSLIQHSGLPDTGSSALLLKLKKPLRFALQFRPPAWLSGKMQVKVNGKEQKLQPGTGGYLKLDRHWKNGDRVTLVLPMQTRAEFMPDGSNWVAFVRGPAVLAAAMGTQDMTGLTADSSRMGHIASGPLLPLDDAPLLVGDQADLAAGQVKLVYQERYKNLKLVPFYRLSNSRYLVYWPYTTRKNLPALLQSLQEKQKEKSAMEARTIDMVNIGEQQPETDHQFQGEQTAHGLFRERHFRDGSGWFSYVLQNKAIEAATLRLTFYGAENQRNFNIFINGKLLSQVQSGGNRGETFYEMDFPVPEALNAVQMTVKFAAVEGSAIAGVYGLQLLRR